MKKKLLAILSTACVLCLSAVLLAGCSSGGETPAPSAGDNGGDAAAPETFTLTVGFDKGYPPYGFMDDDGNFTGIDLDMAKEVCERNGWELKLEAIDWDAKDALLDSGTINCIWNGFTLEGREDKYLFSEPYMLNEQVVVVKADSGIASLEDLAGKTLITQVESAALDVLTDEEDAEMVAFTESLNELQTISDYNNAFEQLKTGIVDAVACDLSIAAYQMAANPDAYVQLDPLSSEHYAVGFKKGETELANTVTDTLKAMYEDGTIKELCDKYADLGVSYENWVLK